MAEIIVSRPDEAWANRFRSYKVFVDGKAAASLGRGQESTIEVTAGRHSLRATLDWGSSPTVEVELAEGDRAYVLCQSGFKFSLARPRALLYITIWRKRYLDLRLIRIESHA